MNQPQMRPRSPQAAPIQRARVAQDMMAAETSQAPSGPMPAACNVVGRQCGPNAVWQWLGQDATYNPADKGRPPTASSTGYAAATQIVTAASATGNLAISFTPECPFVAKTLFVSPQAAPFLDLVAAYVYDTRRNMISQDAPIGDVLLAAELFSDMRVACALPSLPDICFDRENPLFLVFYLKPGLVATGDAAALATTDIWSIGAGSGVVPATFRISAAIGGYSGQG